jgi:hypothetical protein
MLRQERVRLPSLLVHALLVALLFLWHLAAWGDYGVIMGCLLATHCWGLYREQRRPGPCVRRALLLILPTIPSLILFGLYMASNRDVAEGSRFHWGTVERKATSLLGIFRGYDWKSDAAVLLLWLGAVVVGFRFRAGDDRRGGLLLSVFALAGLYLVLPFQLGSTSDTDTRLLPALLVCLVGYLGRFPTRRMVPALGLLALALLLRYGSVIVAWERLRDRLDVASESLDVIAPGSRVLPVVMVPTLNKEWPECHFVCWSVVRRGTFVPYLFHARDQQPLAIREPYQGGVLPDLRLIGGRAGLPDLNLIRTHFDVVWLVTHERQPPPRPEAFEELFSRDGVKVWRIR